MVLQSVDPGQQFTWENSNLEVNKPKNRYANVIAYDHSRVILAPIDGESFFRSSLWSSPLTLSHTTFHSSPFFRGNLIAYDLMKCNFNYKGKPIVHQYISNA